MRTFAKLTGSEFRLFLREPVLLFFSVFFPCVLVGILGAVPSFREPDPAIGGMTVIALYVTIAVILTMTMLAIQFTPGIVATYRERGILRRLSTTPVSPVALLGAQVTISALVTCFTTALLLTLGWLVFKVPVPHQLFGYLVAFAVTAAALFAIALFVAAVVPSGKAAQAVGTILFFPLMFFAGLWVPREAMPAVVRRIADFTPLGAGEHALHDAAAGAFPHIGQLAVLVGYVVVFGIAAARLFRWE
jgi:ABC-2 type transport system permease protein